LKYCVCDCLPNIIRLHHSIIPILRHPVLYYFLNKNKKGSG
jgi:hypothetical protein